MIIAENVVKQFMQEDEVIKALFGVNLHVKKGECVVLKGSSGSGKSTLLSLIAGLAQPTSGKIVIDGREISKLPEHFSAKIRRDKIGFIFQKFHLLPHLTALENVIAPLIPHNLPYVTLKEKALKSMKICDISHKAMVKVNCLSGGEQQRVAISRALVAQPSIVLADEPTANLDASLSRELVPHFELLKTMGVTQLIATHDPLFFDLKFVDRVVELQNGVIAG